MSYFPDCFFYCCFHYFTFTNINTFTFILLAHTNNTFLTHTTHIRTQRSDRHCCCCNNVFFYFFSSLLLLLFVFFFKFYLKDNRSETRISRSICGVGSVCLYIFFFNFLLFCHNLPSC